MTDDFDLTAWNNGELCEHGEQWHADCKPAADGTPEWVYMTEGFSAAFHYRQTALRSHQGNAKSNDPAVHLPRSLESESGKQRPLPNSPAEPAANTDVTTADGFP